MKNFYPLLESPDEIFTEAPYRKRLTDYDDDGAYAFGILDGHMRHSQERGTHADIGRERRQFQFPGRIWTKPKLISFWVYPKDNTEMKSVIDKLEDALEIKIWDDPDYRLEINELDGDLNSKSFKNGPHAQWEIENEQTKKLIPVKDFAGSKDASDEEMSKMHLDKNRNKQVKGNYGSKKYGSEKPLNYRQMLQAESFYSED